MNGFRVLERVTRNAALGIRFWDIAGATTLVEGLVVELFPRTQPGSRVMAQANRSGIYVVHAVPGLRDFEFSDAEPEELWATATRPYRIEVRDPLGRFIPMAFDADLPVHGLFTWLAPWMSPPQAVVLPTESGSPPSLFLQRVPLFSTPSRPVPDPMAVLYAHLRDLGTQQLASWCLLAVAIEGETRGLGLADREGRIAVMFPYPEPARMSLGSPPEARNDFQWQLELTAYPSTPAPPAPVPELADLGDVLNALSSPRAVIESALSPSAPMRLGYRQPLTLRTAGLVGPDASCLLVSA